MKNRERLIQEDYVETDYGPWKVLVICLCLNVAAWPVAELVVKELFKRYPDPYECDEVSLNEDDESYQELYDIVKDLGLGHRRVKFIIKMSRLYVEDLERYGDNYDRYHISEFSGCGVYAQDAWALMVLKESRDPKDKHLRRYAKKVGLLNEGS